MAIFLAVAISVTCTAAIAVFLLNISTGEQKIQHRVHRAYGVADEQFGRTMSNLLSPPLTPGNRIQTLLNGDQIFPAMLDAIRAAERTICFETYIYWSGRIGEAFTEALAERASGGVRVHVLLDALGSGRSDPAMLQRMREAGCEVDLYHATRFKHLARMNNRTHRKLLVVDGRVGFTGGVGIADPWLGHAQDPDHWRDVHYRLDGPAVAQMQTAFLDNWMKTRGEVLHNADYYPALDPAGECLAQVFTSSPREGADSARLLYLLSITCATRTLDIANSYFVPDDLSVQTLVDAAKRGVRVRIIVPGEHIDTRITRRASRARWGPLLQAGIEIHEYQPTMYHCKVMTIDGLWCSVGSTNFDNRSFRLNDEANLNVLDHEFAGEQTRQFEADLLHARQITLEMWRRRPLREKVIERTAELLRSQV